MEGKKNRVEFDLGDELLSKGIDMDKLDLMV